MPSSEGYRKPQRVFLSYLRADDPPFIERLSKDLKDRGVEVWFDQTRAIIPTSTFTREITDALDHSDRFVLILSPGAISSDFVRAEWRHALASNKPIVPILRIGDYSQLPPELSQFPCPDFRENRPYEKALEELLAILQVPLPPLGPLLTAVPERPPYFQPRAEDLLRVREALLGDSDRPVVITSAQRTIGLHGMGGTGKSVLAAELARDGRVRRAFSDGVLWLSMGHDADVQRIIRVAAAALGDDSSSYFNLEEARQRLRDLLKDKTCLIVIDDLWQLEHVEPFQAALGPRCRLLITTRDMGLLKAFGAWEHSLDVLNPEEALALLAQWSGQPHGSLPAEASEVARASGYLPLALTLIGAQVREGMTWADALDGMLTEQRNLAGYPHRSVMSSINLSLDALPADSKERFLELAVFPNVEVPEAAVLTMWTRRSAIPQSEARRLLATLTQRALLRLSGESGDRRVILHELLSDYLRRLAGDRFQSLHDHLVSAYAEQCPVGWPTGPNDGYFFQYLPYHLAHAARTDVLRDLLLNFDWLQAKLNATDAIALLSDFTFLPDDDEIQLVEGACRLSVHILYRDRTQLAPQLVGRLAFLKKAGIRRLLRQASSKLDVGWLSGLSGDWTAPGGPLVQTMAGHKGRVHGVALTPDGRRAVSASHDGTLKVWDLETGREIHTLVAHSGSVSAVAVTPDGRRAVSAHFDKTLKVWDLETGRELNTLVAHSDGVFALAITADGRRIVSASLDRTLKVLDLDGGRELQTLLNHEGRVGAVGTSSDGRLAVCGHDDTLKVWDLQKGLLLGTMRGHEDMVRAVAVSVDGRRVLSGSQDGTLKLWDLDAGLEMLTRRGHAGGIFGVAMTPDGRSAVSASDDQTLKLWDLEQARELCTLRGHRGPVSAVAITADGGRAVSASADETLKVWDLTKAAHPEEHEDAVVSLLGLLSSPETLATELARIAMSDRTRLHVLESPDVLGVREMLTTWMARRSETDETPDNSSLTDSSRLKPNSLWLAWMVNVQGPRLQQISQELLRASTSDSK